MGWPGCGFPRAQQPVSLVIALETRNPRPVLFLLQLLVGHHSDADGCSSLFRVGLECGVRLLWDTAA